MSLELNDHKAIGILMWWIEGADGSIGRKEEKTIENILSDMDYSMQKYRQKTKMFISGLSSQHMEKAIDQSIQWGAEHFDNQRKQQTIKTLKVVARSNEKTENEQQNITQIKEEWNVT